MADQCKVDIVMTVWNRPNFTRLALDSIINNTKHKYRLIVVDNGSETETHQILDIYYKSGYIDILVNLDKNYGLEYAKHRAMTFVDSRLFISTDNDIMAYKYDPDWLDQMIDLIDQNPEYAAIGCRPQILVGTGNIFEGKTEDIIEFSHVPGYLRIMRTDFIKEAGAWRDERELRGHEEYWISLKLKEMGMKVGWANNIRCWHLFGNNNWGYDNNLTPAEHGHGEVSSLPHDDREEILKGTGIDIWVMQ